MMQDSLKDKICVGTVILVSLLVLILVCAGEADSKEAYASPEYVRRLFDDTRVHTIDIQMDNWRDFTENAGKKEFTVCSVGIDGEIFPQTGIRAKGSNSLKLTGEYGLSRYSLVLEFDHYIRGNHYYGLDRLSLDACFQDNSYLKAYMAYDMMKYMEVPSPLCSYVWVTVNGADWGLFLATEEPEESFALRNFGVTHGNLYKPDYRSLGDENADLALKYIDDDPKSYPNIFDNAQFLASKADRKRLIAALKTLDAGEALETAVNVDEVLRYFTVQVFVMNWDSYLGRTGHNYLLYEENGRISMLPWDYNLAFGTYALGMTDPIRDPNVLINYPINTPAEGGVMLNRPLYHNLMQHREYFTRYHDCFERFLSGYMESGRFEQVLQETEALIAPYVEKDPTAFCSPEDHALAVDTLREVCLLRAQSVRGQLKGEIPATLRGQQETPQAKTDASGVELTDLGDFEDLREKTKSRQDAAMKAVEEAGNQVFRKTE